MARYMFICAFALSIVSSALGSCEINTCDVNSGEIILMVKLSSIGYAKTTDTVYWWWMRDDAGAVSTSTSSMPVSGNSYCYYYSSAELGGVDSTNFDGIGVQISTNDGIVIDWMGVVMEDDVTVHCWDNCNCFIDRDSALERGTFQVGEDPCFADCSGVEYMEFTIHST
eukprot:Rmarinus@m.24979